MSHTAPPAAHSLPHFLPNPAFRLFRAKGFLLKQPHPQLSPWVQCFWLLTADKSPAFNGFNLYADGGASLNIHFSTTALPAFSFVQQSQRWSFNDSCNTHIMGIRFKPGGAWQLLGKTLDNGNNKLNLPAQWHRLFAPDNKKYQTLTSPEAQFQQRINDVETQLLKMAEHQQAEAGLIQRTLSGLLGYAGSIENFCQGNGINRRAFERRCRTETGFSPHQLRELHRITQARHRLTLAPTLSLANLAQDSGFFDQAHFTRRFQKITGQTPGQYQQRKLSQLYNPTG